jgi:hypothetical protein
MATRDASGRFARKAWTDLAPKTRAEKLRHGIGRQEHEQGVSVRTLRTLEKEVEKYYGRDPAEVRQELMTHDLVAVQRASKMRQKMHDLYDKGRHSEARALWEQRDQSLPEWMFFYHGAFS